MKKLLIVLFSCISFVSFGQATRADLDEPNPNRGMYINSFFVLDPVSWNGGTPPYVIAPNLSILGTDADHDGIFEKERELLEYCRDNHITFIVLLNLHQLFGSGVMLWDENLGRTVTIEDHLCRFMNDARNNYCIDQIGAAADNAKAFQNLDDIQAVFKNKTPAITIPSTLRSSFSNVPNISIIEDPTLLPPDPRFYESECLKFYYRATFFTGTENCETFFNYMHMEYEFWQGGFWDEYTGYSRMCTTSLNSAVVLTSTMDGIEVGSEVHGSEIPANTTVVSLGVGSFTISQNATGNSAEKLWFSFVMDNTINSTCCNNVSISVPCTTTVSSNVINTASTFGIYINSLITGPGLPVGSIITTVGSTSFTINQNAVSSQIGSYTIEADIQQMSTNNCATTTGPHRWYNREYAKYFSHFKPTIRAMHRIAFAYNSLHNYPPTDIHYMRLSSYLQEIFYSGGIPVTIPVYNDFISFLDGTSGPVPHVPPFDPVSDCQVLPTHSTGSGDPVDQEGRINRLCPHAFEPYANHNPPLNNDYSFFYNDFNDLNRFANLHYWTNWQTDIHPLLNAEKISNGGYDDYWGKWFEESAFQNIFEAEKLFYADWRINAPYFADAVFDDNENSIHPGGFLWFTQSHMVKPLGKPLIFIPEFSSCSAGGTDATFHYIGPNEAGVTIEFKVVSNDFATMLFPDVVSGLPWFETATRNNWNPNVDLYAAPDIIATDLPLVVDGDHPFHCIVQLTYEGNCQYVDTFDLVILNGPSIQAMGATEICQGESITLQSGVADIISTDFEWFRDGVPIPSSDHSTLTVSEGGVYSCEVTNSPGSCDGMSNEITVIIKPFPFTTILLDCSSSPTYNMYAGPIIAGLTPVTNGPGGITYSWSSGETVDRISTTTNGWYYLTVTSPNGCSKTENIYYRRSGTAPVISVTATSDPTPSCANNGTATISIPSGDVIHAVLSDGVTTEYLDWSRGGSRTLTNLSPGNYVVYVAIGGGSCYSSVSFTIGTVSTTLAANFTSTDVSCNNGDNGTIILSSVSGNAGDVSIEIPSIGYINNNIPNSAYPLTISTDLSAGIYIINIRDSDCSFITETITINQPNEIDVTFTHVNVSGCHNSLNGSAVATASNGNSPYTYVWDVLPAVTGQSLTSVGFGTYYVTVTDDDGCTATDFVNISAPAGLTVSSVVLSDATCTDNDGSAEVNVIGGTAPYSYSWSPTGGSTNVVTNLVANTYTCTVTDAGSCTATSTVIISSVNSGLLASSAIDVPIACFGGNASVTVSATSGTTPYSGTGTFSAGAGTFTTTVTDASGCTSSTSILVNQPDQLQVGLSQSATGCFGGNGNEISSTVTGGTGPFTYLWTPGSASTPGITNLFPGTYSVIVTDANGCTRTNSITISNNPNCCFASGGDIIFADGPLTLPSYTGTRSLNFNATVQVLNPVVTFNALNLVIGSGNSITVQNGCTLNIIAGSNLHACVNMWKGIIVEPGGVLNISGGSIISDAENGVFLKQTNSPTTYFEANTAIFRNNYIGIYMEPNSSINFNTITMKVIESRFISPGPLLPSTSVTVGNRTNTGIFINDWTGTIGQVGSLRNEFDNLHLGIRSNRAILNVVESEFNHILPDPIYTFSPFGGSGIYASGGSNSYSLTQTGDGMTGANSFSDCTYGVYSNAVPVMVRQNNMKDVVHGVFLTKLPTESYSRVINNKIQCIYDGVTSQLNNDIQYIFISGNEIEVNNNTGKNNYGVGIGSYDWNKRNVVIKNNYVKMFNGQYGIELRGVEAHLVYNNNIDFSSSSTNSIAGFSAESANKNLISCNYSHGNTGTSDYPHYAYYFGLSKENDILCDDALEFNYGFQFDGFCSMTDKYRGNYMDKNWTGLNFNFDGEISDQWHGGNKWVSGGFSSGYEAINPNSGASKFFVNSLDGIIYNPVNPNPISWFNVDFSNNAYSCFQAEVCTDEGGSGEEGFGNFERQIATDDYDPLLFPDESKWMARASLFRKLSKRLDVLSDVDYASFYSLHLNTKIDMLNEVKNQSEVIYDKLASDSMQIVDNDSIIKSTVLSIENCENSFQNGVISIQQYNSIMTTLNQVLNDILMDNRQVEDYLKTESDLKADAAQVYNAGIAATEQYELNEKFVNDIYLRKISKGDYTIDPTDTTQLKSVALQCPFLGGSYVYLARNLYRLIKPEATYDDYTICHALGIMRKRNPGKPTFSDAYVYPNPASKELTVSYVLDSKIETKMLIFDSSLRLSLLINLDVNFDQMKFSVENLTPGLYIYNIVQDSHVISTGKLNVIH